MATDEKCAPHSDFVAVPRWVLDEVLPINGLPATYLRVLLFVVRKTLGWQKREDCLSLSQIEIGANVGRRDACGALVFWKYVGVIEVRRVGKLNMNLVRLKDGPVAEGLKGRIWDRIVWEAAENRKKREKRKVEKVLALD
jgi:hypothetical protein